MPKSLTQKILDSAPTVGVYAVPYFRDLSAADVRAAADHFGIPYTNKAAAREALCDVAHGIRMRSKGS